MSKNNKEKEFFDQAKLWLKKPAHSSELDLLKEVIRYHEWRYYVLNQPVISDYEFDQLFVQLKSIENNHPNLITSDSPTQRVSSDLTEGLEPVEHMVPMLSLDNSYNADDLRKFDEQVKKLADISLDEDISYSVEPKYDGGSVALLYQDDKLIRAATRGNGSHGEEITFNMKTLPSVPLRVPFSSRGIYTAEIRGEGVIKKDIFEQLNKKREEAGLALFANPRNSATGGLRMKDPNETRARGLEIFAFQLGYAADMDDNDQLVHMNEHHDQIKLLSEFGFKVPNVDEMICENIDAVISRITAWEKKREEYPYEIDGAVVKVNSRKIQEKCGSTQHHPRWAIAYKFKAKQATTTLLDVEYQVGKIGSITPVAKVDPVHLAGVTVSSISLHNEEFIRSKDLRIGDKIVIERAGDVIPYIVKSLEDLRDGSQEPLDFPIHCPINTTAELVPLVKIEGEAAWRCVNCICGEQELQKIIFHVSKAAMDIDGFGRAYVERFHELGWIEDISDVYNLDYERIAELEGFGQKSADNLKLAIDKAKENPLSKLLHSLSIHHLGKKASKLIAAKIQTIYDLSDWDEERFLSIKDIGPVVANNVISYFREEKNIELIKKLEQYGVNINQTDEDKPIEVAADAPLVGKTILFTGSLQQMSRSEAKKIAEAAGAKALSAVSSNLNILVVGEKAGSKLKKAQAISSIEIWTEADFIDKVNA